MMMPDPAHGGSKDEPILQSTEQWARSPRIVLVEPAGGLNVGSIARAMKNMGLYRLVLVSPKCDPLGEDAQRMAVHANDVLTAAEVVSSIPDALNGCQRVVATTARDRDLNLPMSSLTPGLTWLLNLSQPSHQAPNAATDWSNTALLFGPEDRGLSNAELIYAQHLINIPTNPDYASLNLAQAVAICCYELRKLIHAPLFQDHASLEQTSVSQSINDPSPHLASHLAPVESLEGYYQQLEAVLLHIGYLYPHTAKRRMEKFRILFNRSQLSQNEVAMLRGILRQITWATAEKQPGPERQTSESSPQEQEQND